MAIYTVVGTYIECVGTDITSLGIHNAIVANPSVGASVGTTIGARSNYTYSADVRIGNSGSSGSSSIWDASNDQITINAVNGFEVYGSVLMGAQDANGASQNGGSFVVITPSNDTFSLYANSVWNCYGSYIYSSKRIIVRGNDCQIRHIDCDRELEDDIDTGSNQRTLMDYTRSRVHHASSVGLKLFSSASSGNKTEFILSDVAVESCSFALQLGPGDPIVLENAELDTCTNHTVGFVGAGADCTLINPDFLTARQTVPGSGAVLRLEYLYSLSVQDASNMPLLDALVRLTDQQGDNRILAFTDSSGNPITSVTTFQNKTYLVATETVRTTHTLSVRKYENLWVSFAREATANLDNDLVTLFVDNDITQTSAVAAAHTGITVTDDRGAPITWEGLNYSFTVEGDLSVNPSLTAEDIFSYLKYIFSQSSDIDGLAGDLHHQFVVVGGDGYETQRSDASFYSGIQAGVRVIDENGDAFTGIISHQSDDGTRFTPSRDITIAFNGGLLAGDYIRIEDDLGVTRSYVQATSSHEDIVFPGSEAGAGWRYAVDREGFTPDVGDLTLISGATIPVSVSLNPYRFRDGTVMYSLSTNPAVSVSFDLVAPEARITINDVNAELQDIFNAAENLLITEDGMAWHAQQGSVVEWDDIIQGGRQLYLGAGWRLFGIGLNAGVNGIVASVDDQIFAAGSSQMIVGAGYKEYTQDDRDRDDLIKTKVDAIPVNPLLTDDSRLDDILEDTNELQENQLDWITADVSGLSTFNPSIDTVEGSETYDEAFRLVRAEAAGKVAVTGDIVTFRDASDSKDRITATTDSQGQRKIVVVDGS